MHIPAIVLDFLVSGTATGFVGGALLVGFGKQVKAEIIAIWHAACAVGHRFHIKQTTMDDAALRAITAARPAINKALDDAENGLRAERATAAAMEADTTPNGSLAPKPVDAAPLAPPVLIAAAVVGAP